MSIMDSGEIIDELLRKGLKATRESKYIEFKESFDVTSLQSWCEIVKDIVALANTGGGIILIGLDNQGKPTGFDVNPVLILDPAKITDKVATYTGQQFADFEISEHYKESKRIAALRVYAVPTPMVFIRPGTYPIENNKQKTAFSMGTVYFRHGAKSDPGTTEDLRRVFERALEATRKEWARGVRKVITAPRGSEVEIVSGDVTESKSPHATPIRITNDPSAPAFRKLDPDISHPYRLKELLQILNERLGNQAKLSSYDILCLRRLYKLDEDETFFHKSRFSSPQYSEAVVEWILQQLAQDSAFFDKSRSKCFEKRYEYGLASGWKKRRRAK